MMRICFVGNSHLAAVKLGWDAACDEYPDVSASFFGAPSAGLLQMRRNKGGYLVSTDDALTARLKALWGTDRFRPDDYDLLCLVGMAMSALTVGRLYRAFRSSAHRNRNGDFRLVSPECFQAAANGLAASSLSAHVLQKIRAVSERPVVIAAKAAPCPAPGKDHCPAGWVKDMLDVGDDRLLFDTFAEAVRQLPGADFFLPQPESTQLNLLVTKPEYGEGSQRLKAELSKHEEEETNHMNAAYGALVIRDLYDLLRREGLASTGAPQANARALRASA
jgi:hypothetical protein